MICLIAMSVTALVRYTGSPRTPYLIYGVVSWNDQLLSGARLQITNQNTGFTMLKTTDSKGYYVENGGNWLTNAGPRYPAEYGDVVVVKVLDGCGVGDVCEKSIIVQSEGNEYKAVINFDINGELNCPPISCPSCPSTSCSDNDNDCPDCPTTSCPDTPTCTEEECVDTVCPTTDCPDIPDCKETTCEEPICPVVPDSGFGGAIAIILGIIASIGGGLKIYKNRAGGVTMLHRHRGILGYHNPNTQHRNIVYRHAAFSKDPKKYAEDIKRIESG